MRSAGGNVPPPAPKLPEFDSALPTASGSSRETQLEHILYWRDPRKSAIIFGAGNLICFFTLLLGYSFVSLMSFVFFLGLIGCFIYFNLSSLLVGYRRDDTLPKPNIPEKPFNAQPLYDRVETIVSMLNNNKSQIAAIVTCKDNFVTLKAIGVLFAINIVGRIFSDMVLFYLVFLAAFTLPKIYELNKKEIDEAAATAQKRFNEEREKVLQVANERTTGLRQTVTQKVNETASPLMQKVQPHLDEMRRRHVNASSESSSTTSSMGGSSLGGGTPGTSSLGGGQPGASSFGGGASGANPIGGSTFGADPVGRTLGESIAGGGAQGVGPLGGGTVGASPTAYGDTSTPSRASGRPAPPYGAAPLHK